MIKLGVGRVIIGKCFLLKLGIYLVLLVSGSGESVYSGQSGSTIVLRSISGGTNTNVTTVGNLLKIDVTSTFTGNTSATCINDLYISNLYGCFTNNGT